MGKLRLGEILLQEGKIDSAQLQAALSHQKRWGHRLGWCLVQLNFVTEKDLATTLSKALKLPMIELSKIDAGRITKEILDQISLQSARNHRVVPIAIREVRSKKRLIVASSDPTNYQVFDEIQFRSGLPVLVMMAVDSEIDWFIRKYYMGETEVLPEAYTPGIDLAEGSFTKFSGPPDPISTIFSDKEFTGFTNIGKAIELSRPGKRDGGKKKT